MDSLNKPTFNIDIFRPKDLFINGGHGSVPHYFFITSLGNFFVTSNGDFFNVKNG